MAAVGFPDDKQMGPIAFPPEVPPDAAVVVLGTDGNFQHFLPKVNAVAAIQFDGAGVHVGKALEWGCLYATAILQVVVSLRLQRTEGVRSGDIQCIRIVPKIHPDTAMLLLRFTEYQDVYQRGSLCFAGIKGPLIPFQELGIQGLPGTGKAFGQKFPWITAIRCGAHKAGKYLLVTARYIPPKPDGGQPILPFRQVLGAHHRYT